MMDDEESFLASILTIVTVIAVVVYELVAVSIQWVVGELRRKHESCRDSRRRRPGKTGG